MSKKPTPLTRRARGSGSIFFNEAVGRWVGRKVVGHTATGKPIVREVRGMTQAAVVRKLEGIGPAGPGITFAAWAERWLKGLGSRRRPGTVANHEEAMRLHLIPAIGHIRLDALKPSRIETLAADLQEKGLHTNTVNRILNTARAALQAAVRDEAIERNPVSLADRPAEVKRTLQPFTPAELAAIIGEASKLSAGPTIALLAATGCRLGEAAAMDVGDWNEAKGTVSITKTYSRRFGLGPPKSRYSTRTITVPMAARPLLILAAGTRVNSPLFVTEAGKRVIGSLVRRAFRRILSRLELPQRNIHQLRHSVATVLISRGVPLGDVARYLGDSPATVVKTYLHPSGVDAGAAMDGILGSSAASSAAI